MAPGDVIISNHAGTFGQHLNNMIMYTPIFGGEDGRKLIAFMCILAHWIDVGGRYEVALHALGGYPPVPS